MEDLLTENFQKSDIKKTIIAFANSEGGTLYSINDDGTVCGVEITMLRVTNAIRDARLTLYVRSE